MTQGLHGLLRGVAQLLQGLIDLLGARRLRLHAFVDHLHAGRQRLHLLDDLRKLVAHLLHVGHAAPHFLRKLVHAHHARGHGRLDLTHHLLDVVGGHRRLVGQAADLGGHHHEAPAVFAGLLGLDGRVQRQQVGLVGHLRDRGDDLRDIAGFLVQDGQLGVDRTGRAHHVAHGVFHARQAHLSAAGQRSGLLRGAGDFRHGAHQFARGRRDLARGGADLGRGGGDFGRRRLLLLGRGGDLGHRGRHLHGRTLRLADQAGQFVHHAVEALFDGVELIFASKLQPAGQVASARGFQGIHDGPHRVGDGAHQQHAADDGRGDGQRQRHQHADFGRSHGLLDADRRIVGLLLVFGHHPGQDVPAPVERGPQVGLDARLRADRIRLHGGRQDVGADPLVVLQFLLELLEHLPIVLAGDGGAVQVDMLFQQLIVPGQRLQHQAALLVIVGIERVLHHDEAGEPCRPDRRAVVDPRHGVGVDHLDFRFYLQKPPVVHRHHQRHDGQNDQKAGQDALAERQILHAGRPFCCFNSSTPDRAPLDSCGAGQPAAGGLLSRCGKFRQLLQRWRPSAMKNTGYPENMACSSEKSKALLQGLVLYCDLTYENRLQAFCSHSAWGGRSCTQSRACS
ncbi:hypothetical protein D3C86_1188110 [compost metagenome]